MPTLNSTIQPFTEAQERQLALIGLEATKAMEVLFEPVRQMQKTVEVMTEPLRRLQETINNSPMIQIMVLVQEMAESQRKLIEALTISPIFNFPKLTGLGLFPSEIIDGEIREDSTSKDTAYLQSTQTVGLPQSQALVPMVPAMPQYEAKSIIGLKEIAGRSFQYKRKTLKKLSYRNCEGRLLSLFLSSRDLFVSDADIYDKLHIPDGQSFSWVLRNLKRKFRENGLLVTIERRWDPDGYILIDVSYLQ